MYEVVKINLDNEMDLILAHKRSMKIAELCGLPPASQTRFSTAVSEIARCSISHGKESVLVLGINVIKSTQKEILAVVTDYVDIKKSCVDAYAYAAKIAGLVQYELVDNHYVTTIRQSVLSPGLLSDVKIKGFKDYFKYEPPLSPYDEIRKKNIELIALSEKLRESEDRYRQLINTLPVLILVVDDRNRILLTNTWLKDYLEKPLETFDKNSIRQFLFEQDVQDVASAWENTKKTSAPYYGQVRLKKDGAAFWHLISIVPNRSEDNSLNSWLILLVDINAQKIVEETLKDNSDLKVIQQQLEHTNQQLSFKNKELEQFAFIASHDLQEPLRKIMIMLSRAGDYLSAEQRGKLYFDKIAAAANRMSNLIADVLQYSRAENNGIVYKSVDLNMTMAETLNDLSFVIDEKTADIKVAELPVVLGSETQLRQLLYNLINNALKFNQGQPKIEVRATLIDSADHPEFPLLGKYHLITVKDNGIGMDPAYSDKAFNMFQRLHQRDTYGGNGIGLALCRKIVENHNGLITFSSLPGEGTLFKIYLPAEV